MAVYNFTGANGDPLPAGLTAQNGTFEIQNNALTTTGSNPGGVLWVCTGESTSDGTFTANINAAVSSSVTHGVCFRYSDNDNCWLALITSNTGLVRLFKRQGGAYTSYDNAYSIPSYNPATTYELSVECSGTSIVCKVDGSTAVSITNAFNQTATKAGLRFAESSPRPFAEDLTIPDGAASDSITVDDANYNNKVYQRTSSDNKLVSFGVTYTGAPTALQYRVLDAADDTTEIVSWTTFDASPTGGTSTLNYTASASLTGYHVEVRFSNDVGVTDLQAVDWYVGDVILICGQSLSEDMSTNGSITAVDGYFAWNGSAGVVPTSGVGAHELAKASVLGESVACLIANTGVGGSPLTFEADGGTNWWANIDSTLFQDTLTAIDTATSTDNKISYVYWHQGTRDSIQSVTQDEYLRMNRTGGLTSLFKNIHDNFSDGDGGALNIYVATLGRDTRASSTTDSQHQGIRNALMTMVNADPLIDGFNVFVSATTDGVHATDSAYTQMGKEVAAKNLNKKGLVSIESPELIFVDINTARDTLTLTFNVDLDAGDTNYSTEGIRVESDNVSITVNSFTRTDTRKAEIVLNSAIPTNEQVDIYLGYGKGATTTGLTYPRTPLTTMIGTMNDIQLTCSTVYAQLSEV